MKECVPFWHVIFGVYLAALLILKLFMLAIIGSEIRDGFYEIKTIILNAPTFEEKSFNDTLCLTKHVALSQIVESMSENTYMTAMGIVKIEKVSSSPFYVLALVTVFC
ncbi:hypothetical protein CEXT_386181 [Caerostris extrusa]|uniref:Uncharacterized protein n=1 Tax=Caerostris extrusa TaxID=172846 RepID=A0AAV4QRX3_CAEEX|nr:hypothetical protein CEXT_386181 [Caerostris extrusa]